MKLQKHDCPIKIELCDVGAGWLKMKLCIDDEILDFDTTYCMGDGFHALLERLYYLHPNAYDNDYSGNIVETTEIKTTLNGENTVAEVPYKSTFYWDEEGSIINWEFEHKPTLKKEFDLHIKLGIHRNDTDVYKEFTVSYKEFCYALAKACTEMLKKHGINGFHESYWDGDINLRHLLFIKAIALDCTNMIKTIYNKENDEVCSDINKELELLLFDM